MARTVNAEVHMVRREAFVDAAERLMQTRGYEQMSVQDVLDDLGASRGAFYHYFDSKQALLEAVLDRMVDAGLGSVGPVVDDPTLVAAAKLRKIFSGLRPVKTDRKAVVLSVLEAVVSRDNASAREQLLRISVQR